MLQLDCNLQRALSMRFIWTILIFICLHSSSASSNEKNAAKFSLKIKGVYVGTLSFSGVLENGKYNIDGAIKSAGVFKLINKQEYTANSSGILRGNRFIPQTYSEYRNKKGRKSSASLSY